MLPGKVSAAATCGASGCAEPALDVVIPFTTVVSVQRSIAFAEGLCSGLPAVIRIVRVVIVPYPLDLHHGTVSTEVLISQMSVLQSSLPLAIDIRFSRSLMPALMDALTARSLVLLTSKRRCMRRTQEQKIARALNTTGRQVSLMQEEKPRAGSILDRLTDRHVLRYLAVHTSL